LETPKTETSQGNPEQKEQYSRYHYTQVQTEPKQQKQHGPGTETGIKTSGTEWRTTSYAHLIADKGARSIQWRKDSLFNKYCLEKWLSA
jgi:hypothetical protein